MKIIKTPISKLQWQEIKKAMLAGKTLVYPTETCYGLAASLKSPKGIANIYKIKERAFKKPVHLAVASVLAAKKLVKWHSAADRLAAKFWPGPLSMALPLKSKNAILKRLGGGSGYLGVRMPRNKTALELAKLAGPITATSANPSAHKSGGYDAYSLNDVLKQFKNKKHKPDYFIDAGKLPKVRPSTFVKITDNAVEILRSGPVSQQQIYKALKN